MFLDGINKASKGYGLLESPPECLGCYEGYNLINLNAKDNMLLDTVEYFPSISILKCDFSNADIDEGARKMVETNGFERF